MGTAQILRYSKEVEMAYKDKKVVSAQQTFGRQPAIQMGRAQPLRHDLGMSENCLLYYKSNLD